MQDFHHQRLKPSVPRTGETQVNELGNLDLPPGFFLFLRFPDMQVISSSNGAEHMLSAMSLRLITFKALGPDMGFPSPLKAKAFPFRPPSSECGHFLHSIFNGQSCTLFF